MSAYTFEEICSQHDVWLHMEGHALAGLALLDEESKIEENDKAESKQIYFSRPIDNIFLVVCILNPQQCFIQ